MNHVATELPSETQRTSIDHEMWAASGLDMALYKIEKIRLSLIHAAGLLRENEAGANHLVGHCVDGLERFLETILVTRCALKLDFSRIHIDGIALSQIEQEFSSILAGLLEYHEKQDYTGIADKVEYELLANLGSWAQALRQLQISRSSNS